MSASGQNNLPANWQLRQLGELCTEINSGNGFPKEFQGHRVGDYPFAKVGDISRCYRAGETYLDRADHYLSEEVRRKIKARVFPARTIVFPKIGEALRGNYRVITACEMLFDNNVMGVTADPEVLYCKYLFYFLKTQDFGRFSKATTVPSIRRGEIESIDVPLPALDIQRKVVEKIEALLSELDKGIESLKTAREQLKVYRQAVLKHAFEGKLTAHWREQNKDKFESSERLLTRIQQEREARYQQQLQDWKAAVKVWEKNGKKGKKPGKPKNYKNIVLPNAEEVDLLPEIPNGWAWLCLGKLSEISGGLTKNQKRNAMARRMKYLRVANVYADRLLLDDIQEIGVTEDEAKKVLLKAGDILVVEGNGSVEQIGRVALWDGSVEDCGHQNHLIRVRLSGFIDSRVVLLFLLSPLGR